MAWPDTSLVVEVALELGADLTADPSTYAFATDITPYVFDRDGNSSITISRGRQDESTQSGPSSCTLTVDNSDGRFSPRNPTGPYYPRLKRNTPIRVRVNPGSGLSTEFVGNVSEWPPQWDVSEADHRIPVRADGVLRRLTQARPPEHSVMYREITSAANTPSLVAYWPCEDASSATSIASAITGGKPMVLNTAQDITLANYTGFAGSDPLPTLGVGGGLTAFLKGPVPRYAAGTAYFRGLYAVPTAGLASAPFMLTIDFSGGTIGKLQVQYVAVGALNLLALSSTLATLDSTGAIGFAVDGEQFFMAVDAVQNGADVDVGIFVQKVSSTGEVEALLPWTDTFTGLTLGYATRVQVGVADGMSVGHLVLASTSTPLSGGSEAIGGYAGEQADDRFARLCTENSVAYDVTLSSASPRMGPQPKSDLLTLLRECEAAGEGLVVERRTGQLGFDNLADRYNLPVALTLDYDSGHVSPPLDPTDDDQRTRNDVTVTRTRGSSGRIVDEDGPVGVTKVGRYDEGVTLNLFSDDQTLDHAGWR